MLNREFIYIFIMKNQLPNTLIIREKKFNNKIPYEKRISLFEYLGLTIEIT